MLLTSFVSCVEVMSLAQAGLGVTAVLLLPPKCWSCGNDTCVLAFWFLVFLGFWSFEIWFLCCSPDCRRTQSVDFKLRFTCLFFLSAEIKSVNHNPQLIFNYVCACVGVCTENQEGYGSLGAGAVEL